MIKILANDGLEADGILLLSEADIEVDTQKIPQDQLAKELPKFDGIIVRSDTKIRKELIDQCPNLKIIARAGVGMDNIDVEYAQSKGIRVINTPGASTRSVAELAMAHIFALSRKLHVSKHEMASDLDGFSTLKKIYSKGSEISGKTLGIIGFGRIGQEVAKLAMGASLRILPYDPYVETTKLQFNIFGNDNLYLTLNINTVSMDRLIEHSDIITLHLPFNSGQAIIGEKEINRMKRGSILINTSRGGAIDEEALLNALDSGQIAGAGLDVFVGEPKPNPRILSHPNISVTPHIGGSTSEAQGKIGIELADQIINYFEHNP